jgi:hypothetical protein
MVWTDYRRDSAGTRRILRDGDMADAVEAAAEDVAEEARAVIASEAYKTGALMWSVYTEREDLTGRARRVGFAVKADDPAAVPIQFGKNVHVPPGQVTEYLDEAARRAGLDIRDDPGD